MLDSPSPTQPTQSSGEVVDVIIVSDCGVSSPNAIRLEPEHHEFLDNPSTCIEDVMVCDVVSWPVLPELCEDLLTDAVPVCVLEEPIDTTLAIAEAVVSEETEPVPPVGHLDDGPLAVPSGVQPNTAEHVLASLVGYPMDDPLAVLSGVQNTEVHQPAASPVGHLTDGPIAVLSGKQPALEQTPAPLVGHPMDDPLAVFSEAQHTSV